MADIFIQSLNKHYPIVDDKGEKSLEVLRDISINIKDGEFVTFFGRNACGKSTLLRILAGLETPDDGAILRIGGKSPSDIRIGYVFQNYSESLFPWRTALENIAFPLQLAGLGKEESSKQTRDFLKELKIEIPESSYPYKLSGGQQQMISILRAFNYKPDIFFLDEPFSSLDYQARMDMRDLFLKLWRASKNTVVFISHEIDEAIYLCDKMIMLTERPASIANILTNNLPRPRSPKCLTDPGFLELRKNALETFAGEVRR